jgi:uncharacterized membrane protein
MPIQYTISYSPVAGITYTWRDTVKNKHLMLSLIAVGLFVTGLQGSLGEQKGTPDQYQFTIISIPGDGTDAYGINQNDQVVGQFIAPPAEGNLSGVRHGFIYDGETITIADFPSASGTTAYGINRQGNISGLFTDSEGKHGFLAKK